MIFEKESLIEDSLSFDKLYARPEIDFLKQFRCEISRGHKISPISAETSDFINILTSLHRSSSSFQIPDDARNVDKTLRHKTCLRYWAKKFGIQPHLIDLILRSRKHDFHEWPSSDLPFPNYRSYPLFFPVLEQHLLPDRLDSIRHFLTPSTIKQYRPSIKCGELFWEDDFCIDKNTFSTVREPLRTPPAILRTLINRRKSLLHPSSFDASGRSAEDASTIEYIFTKFSDRMLVAGCSTTTNEDRSATSVPPLAQASEEKGREKRPKGSSAGCTLDMKSEFSIKVLYISYLH